MIPISSRLHYRISWNPDWTEKSGFWKGLNTFFSHPNNSRSLMEQESLHTYFPRNSGDKNQDTSNPAKHLCVAYKNPLQTIHTTNPIPKLSGTTPQQHGQDPRLQLPDFLTNTPTWGSDHQHIFHHGPTSLWTMERKNAKSRNRLG